MFTKTVRIAALLAAFAVALPVLAGGGGFGGGGPGGGGGFGGGAGGFGGGGGGFGGMTVTDRIRQQIQFTDDEWTVIQPKLQKVIDAQTALQPSNNRRGGFGGGGGAAQPAAQDPVVVAQQQLALALQDQNAATDNIAAKLQALRDARAKAKENLAKLQDDLKRVLTVRQEAMLVQLGYLE